MTADLAEIGRHIDRQEIAGARAIKDHRVEPRNVFGGYRKNVIVSREQDHTLANVARLGPSNCVPRWRRIVFVFNHKNQAPAAGVFAISRSISLLA